MKINALRLDIARRTGLEDVLDSTSRDHPQIGTSNFSPVNWEMRVTRGQSTIRDPLQ
jgi:hypothetical protein